MVASQQQRGKVGKIMYLVEMYSEAIKRVKQEGGFLNQVRPEFLLSYSQYISYQNHRRKLVCSQCVYEVLSVESWISLFYQLCKVYIQPQIT